MHTFAPMLNYNSAIIVRYQVISVFPDHDLTQHERQWH